MDKVDSTQEQMGNVSREMEVLRKNQEEGLQVKSTGAQMRIYLGGPRADWTQLRKEPLSLSVGQQRLPTLKSKGEKMDKPE